MQLPADGAEYGTTEIPGVCREMVLYECPRSILELAIELARGVVTVENFRPVEARGVWVEMEMQLHPGDVLRTHTISAASFDVFMTKAEFSRHLELWDRRGVYAVFTERGPVKFRASELDPAARYRALRNFGWTLELAIPGPSGGEWGTISSPDRAILDPIVEAAARHYGSAGR